jgi:hypothetical protein
MGVLGVGLTEGEGCATLNRWFFLAVNRKVSHPT